MFIRRPGLETSTMPCIPEFLKCQQLREAARKTGPETEGSWAGGEMVHGHPSSMSKWTSPLIHALPKTQSLGQGVKTKTPEQELEVV